MKPQKKVPFNHHLNMTFSVVRFIYFLQFYFKWIEHWTVNFTGIKKFYRHVLPFFGTRNRIE